MRAIGGIVAGLIASLIAAIVVGVVGALLTFTLPPGTTTADTRQVLMSLPLGTQFALAAAWFAGALCGAWVAKSIARRDWAGWAVALIVAAYFGLNASILPLPVWMKALWVIGPLLGGLIGNRLVRDPAVIVATEFEAPPANP